MKTLLFLLSLAKVVASDLYCPNQNDLVVAYTTPGSVNKLMDQGWMSRGGGAVATRAAYDLLGGWVEFDVDMSQVRTKVNANVYTISPSFNPAASASFQQTDYCDGAATGDKWCVEVDWIEANGNCGGATTLHTVEGPGNTGCTAWGCRSSYLFNGRSKFHMRVEYGIDGSWTTTRDGQVIDAGDLQPVPRASDWSSLTKAYRSHGAVIYSSLWTGWVPAEECGTGTGGDLAHSSFIISNLTVKGSIVQGPNATRCGAPPTPPPPCVDPNDGKTTDGTSCEKQKEWGNCGASWMEGYCCKTCYGCSGSDRCGSVVELAAESRWTQCTFPKQPPTGICAPRAASE